MIKNGALVASLALVAGALAGVAGCGIDVTGVEPVDSDAGAPDTGRPDTGAPDIDAGPAATFSIGGSVTGLEGDGLVLENNGDTIAISKSSASFVFPKKVAKGATFEVKARTQPTGPAQTCVVTGGSGTASADVTDVKVACTTNEYPITVTVAGLAGSGLVLTNNGGDDLAVTAAVGTSVTATFSKKVASGKPFDVAVKTQPGGPPQNCVVSGGAGTVVAGAVTTVTVNCTTLYTVGGTVTGLTGSGLVLQNNAGDDIPVNANGTFAFPTLATTGTDYAVTVKTNPQTPWQSCAVGNGTGKVATANVSSVTVTCTTDKHTVGGSISGLTGSGLVLQLNGAETVTPASGATSFIFGAIDSGSNYTVSVLTQPTSPSQTCGVTDGSGGVGGADITSVKVACETNKYKVRVQVTGLTGTGLVLQNNGGNDLVVDSSDTYSFTTSISSGAPYLVTVKTLPSPHAEVCQVSSGAGTVVAADVDVLVTCNRRYRVFVTSTSYDGNLGGLSGADAKCQVHADAAGLSGTFKAWLSDATGSPSTRFTRSADPYALVDGTVIADDYAELTSGSLQHPIDKTETGGAPPVQPVFGRAVVWTGTSESGNVYWLTHTCSNWTSSVYDPQGNIVAILGETNETTGWSFAYGGTYCDRMNALFCFEQ
ncbi:MAG: hypothetical protein J0I07_22935 [Myxococcales bacterium]|nr:hypothetical protein [Myxococcales bacterium]